MFSNKDVKDVGEADNLEELEEILSDILENCMNQFAMSSKATINSLGIPKTCTATIATQTSSSLFRFTLVELSSEKRFVDSTTSPTRFDWRQSEDETKDLSGNAKPFSRIFVQNQMSITVSHEAGTQATRLHSRIRTSRDALPISTSSGFKHEILTVTTDYDTPSSDTRSILLDTDDENGNRAVHLSVHDSREVPHTLELPLLLPRARNESTRNPLFARRTGNRLRNIVGSFNNYLRCILSPNNESDRYPYIRDAPPAYSTMYASRRPTMRNWRPFRSNNRSFTAPVPPPSYAQAQGLCLSSYSMDRLFSRNANRTRVWSSRPMTTICPRCTSIILTTIEVRQSTSTHVTVLALFLCGCWPCCLLPYCMNLCKIVDHRCPICHAYLGTYRPW